MAAAQQMMSGYLALIAAQFTTWNPAAKGSAVVLSNGNLTLDPVAGQGHARSVAAKSAGKFYWEVRVVVAGSSVGLASGTSNLELTAGNAGGQSLGWINTSQVFVNAVNISGTSTSYVAGDVLGFALNLGAATVGLYKNNVFSETLSIPFAGPYYAACSSGYGSSHTANFGATPFVYAPPAGFTAGIPA